MFGNAFTVAMLVAVIAMLGLASSQSMFARLAWLGIGALVPPMITLTAVNSNSAVFGEVRLRVEAASLGRESISPVWLGGDAVRDDIRIEGLPPQLASIGPSGFVRAFPARGRDVGAIGSGRAAEAAMVSIDAGAGEAFLGAYPIGPDDRFCVEQCASPAAIWYRIDDGATRLVRADSDGPSLPRFRRRPFFPRLGDMLADTFAYYRPSQAIYPVRDYGRPWSGRANALPNPCLDRFVCDRATRQPVRSFLFRNGNRRLFLALLDPDAVLETRGADGAIRRTTLADGAPRGHLDGAGENGVRLTIWQVLYADAEVDFTTAVRPSRLIRRRVLQVRVAPDRIHLGFALEPTQIILRENIRTAATRLERAGLDAPVAVALAGALGEGAPEQPGNIIRFEAIGGALARAIAPDGGNMGSLIFPRGFTAEGASDRLLPDVGGASETAPARQGIRHFAIGSRGDGGRLVHLSVDRFSFPSVLHMVVLLWGILFAFLQAAVWRNDRTALIVALGLHLMLLLRIFVAIGSAALDPQIDYLATLADALIAYCLLPFVLAWLFPTRAPERFDYLPTGLMLIALAGFLTRSTGASGAMAAAAVMAGLAGITRPLLARGLAPLAAWARRHLSGRRLSVRTARAVQLGPPAVRPWLALALALFVFRLVMLLALNAQERYGIGLSAIYLPASLIVVAGLFNAIRRARTPAIAASAARWTVAAVLLLFVAVPLMVADRGFTLIYLPPVLILAIAYIRPDWRRPARWLAAAPGVVTLLLIGASITTASLAGATTRAPPPSGPEAEAPRPEVLLAALGAATDTSADWWRYEAVVRPDALNEAGTGAAEQIRRWRFLLASFTSKPYGRGFPYEADISDLRQVQADDNVSAVHLIAPFGRSGAAAFVLMLGVMALAALRASVTPPGMMRTAGALALWTIFFAGAYMILANLVLVPFTGRNVYFLAALSGTDLVEGAALVIIAYAGLVQFRRSRA